MENPDLLAVLVNSLREQEPVLRTELASLLEEIPEDASEQHKIADEIAEKERRLALITEDAIENYKKLWASITSSDRLPCPFCFTFDNNRSPLIALNAVGNTEPVKCEVCKQMFYIHRNK